MAFPNSPSDGELYTNGLDVTYRYVSADGKWVIHSQVVGGVTGPQGGQGVTGIVGSVGADAGATGILNFILDGGGVPIETGIKGDVTFPFNFKVESWNLLSKETGSMNVSLWKGNYTDPPTASGVMHSGATGPFINLGIKNQGTSIGWGSPTGSFGDIVRIGVQGATGISLASLALFYKKI
jgi:hypothetical protein